MSQKDLHIALVGNPNSGKSSIFNALTGLHQQVGNFPGVTVDKKTGAVQLPGATSATLIDLPGTYSLYPRRADEWVAYKVLMGADESIKADAVLLVADASNLKRNLLFCSQIIDLQIPVVMALTMNDIAASKGIKIDIAGLAKELGITIVAVNPRKNKGIPELKKALQQLQTNSSAVNDKKFMDTQILAPAAIKGVHALVPGISDYAAVHYLINHDQFPLQDTVQEKIEVLEKAHQFNATKTQAEEIMQRYSHIRDIMRTHVVEPGPLEKKIFSDKLDNILLHRVWGYVILVSVLFILFQINNFLITKK